MKRIPVDPGLVSQLGEQLAAMHLSVEAMCEYLKAHPVALSARTQLQDRVNPNAPTIPVAFYTDGEWIWSAELAEYVCRYKHRLPEEFLDDLAARGMSPRSVSAQQLAEALATLNAGRSPAPSSSEEKA